MGSFLVRRCLQAVVTILLATLVVHVSITVLPGDPVRALFGFVPPPPEVAEAIRRQYNLDEPYVVQYLLYLQDIITFDLGRSLRSRSSVNEIVAEAWQPTFWLVAIALTFQAVVGVGFGLAASLRPGRWSTRWLLTAAATMIALPVVLTAPVLHHFLTIRFRIFPINSNVGGWHAWVLPILVLSAMTLGMVVLFTRAELRQTLRAPFIRFAAASGVAPHRLVGLHAMRAAAPPLVSFLASNLGIVVVGVLIVEGTMHIEGLGSVLFTAIRFQDRSVVVSIVMLITVVVILLNLLADVVVAALDPRARAGLLDERP